MFILILNSNGIAVAKGEIAYNVINENEIEITEEQYSEIEIPCSILIENGKVVSWENMEMGHESVEPLPMIPTIEERVNLIEDTINFLLGL